jgi:3',5'-cyclic AMP phosphodiesterase CpdA
MSDADPVLARFARPATERRTRLAVLSDLHLSLDEEGTWRVSHRTEQRLAAVVESLNDRDLDAVLFDGDLVQSGSRAEFAAFDRLADAIDAPFFAVPGNHDLIAWGEDADDRFTLPAFEDRYAPDGELPFHVRVGGVDLVGLNSNSSTRDSVTDTYEGSLSPETLD